MKNKDIINLMDGLFELSKLNLPLNIKTSYALARNYQVISPIANLIDQQRIDLYKKYGELTEDNTYKVSNEKLELLEKELNELLEIDTKVPIINIQLDNFGEATIPFNIIEKLLPIIKESEV